MSCAAPQTLHVAQLGLFNDPQQRRPGELLDAWASLPDVAEAAAGAGVRVSVVQACAHTESWARAGVGYHFRRSAEIGGLLRTLRPDVVHVHGLDFSRQVSSLARQLPATPIILQDHANRPARLWRRVLQRQAFARVQGIAFCALEQATPFRAAGTLSAGLPVYAIPESSSRFQPGDRAAARQLTRIEGDPAVLWVGHLDANKDPLTILEAISALAPLLPGIRLYLCFGLDPLRAAVERRIAGDPQLQGRVQLRGSVAHAQIEHLMRAADLFVLGSHREGSGYALIEALACGLAPVVTDIPSFRALTGEGIVGRLWPCGQPAALGAALRAVAARPPEAQRRAVRSHFDRELSFEALGVKLAAMYREALGRASYRGAPRGAAR